MSRGRKSKTVEETAHDVSNTMMSMQVTFTPVVEGIAGYKALLVANGFNEATADMMSVDYHRVVMCMIMQANN